MQFEFASAGGKMAEGYLGGMGVTQGRASLPVERKAIRATGARVGWEPTLRCGDTGCSVNAGGTAAYNVCGLL